MGAMATIVVPWLVDRMNDGTQWTSMAWWIHDHLEVQRIAVLSEACSVQYRMA